MGNRLTKFTTRTGKDSLHRAASAALALSLGVCAVPDTTAQQEAPSPSRSGSGWKIPFWGTTSGPVLAGGLLYAGSGDGAVYALHPASGAVRWRFQTGEGLSTGPSVGAGPAQQGRRAVAATPVVARETVLVGSRDYSFYALDAATGARKWSIRTEGEFYDAALLHGGNVLFMSMDGFLRAADIGTGDGKWEFATTKRLASELIIEQGIVYLTGWPRASSESFLYAIDATSGLAKWTLRAEGGFPSSPRHVDGRIYFSTGTTRDLRTGKLTSAMVVTLYAVDAASGKVAWKFDAEAKAPESAPIVAVRDTVIVGTDRGTFALHRETGALRWSRIAKASEMLGPTYADGDLVYLTSQTSDGNVHALNPATGEVKWSSSPGCCFPFGGPNQVVRKIAAIQGDTIYATGYEYLRAMQRETGQAIWSMKVVNNVHTRPLVADGMVFIPGSGVLYQLDSPTLGYFYAVDAATGKP